MRTLFLQSHFRAYLSLDHARLGSAVLLFLLVGCATRPVVDPEFHSGQLATHGVGIIGVTTVGAGLHPFTEGFERTFQKNFQKRSSVPLVIPRQLVPLMDRKKVRAFLKAFSEVPNLEKHDLVVFDPVRGKVRFLILAHIHLDEIKQDESSSSDTPTVYEKNSKTGKMEWREGETEYTITRSASREMRVQTIVIDPERKKAVWHLTAYNSVDWSNSETSTYFSRIAPDWPSAPGSEDVMDRLVARAVKGLFTD